MNKDIVLIPGALATPKLWQHQENYFQSKVQFHYVDVLGSQSISEMANRFAKNAPDRFTLLGFSMGGYIALELFNLIPHKIEKLILINSAARTVSEKGQIERERSLSLINKGKFDFLISLIFKNSIHDKSKHDSLLPIAQEMALEVGSDNYEKQLNAILDKQDHSTLLSTIECPTLLLASKQDNVMPNERSEHMAHHIKNSELIYIENCGHLATLEQPEKINQILENWLL
jgi:pimeloyl-ACP methyl ester carboxylesterase